MCLTTSAESFCAQIGCYLVGTPAQIARPADDASTLTLDETRARRKNAPGDQAMRRSIQDLVSSIDPNVKIEPEVEDVRVSQFRFLHARALQCFLLTHSSC